jgi:N-methylhydantoinase A
MLKSSIIKGSDSELRISVDIGGTFTDCIVLQETGGIIVSTKALTTPRDPSLGVISALEIAASLLNVSIEQLLKRTVSFIHGTTVGTNALTTRRGARTGLLTTRGHEHALLIGRVRQKVTGLSEREKTHVTHLTKATPAIVDIRDIKGVTERVDAKGAVVVPLNVREVEGSIDELVRSGVQALAICLLWSFLNPDHERVIAEVVRRKYPNIFVSLSSEIAPRVGEYERCVSTVFNSYIGPLVGDYITRLESKLKSFGLPTSMLVIQANGGLCTVPSVLGRPLLIVDSGPAGGVLGAKHTAEQIGLGNVLCADIGGTTFDVGLVFDDRVQMDPMPTIDKYAYLIPKIFVKSIGAGGGSIAWVDSGKSLRVGPQSAGSTPGPVAYGLGGTEPTVTDALVVLGYLDPEHLLGRRVKINHKAAVAALASLGEQLDMSAIEVAAAVLQISNAQMADLARKVTVERGLDPRDFALFTYGGAGPLFGAFIAREIGAKLAYVPAESGVFSAYGMSTTDVAFQEERSLNLRSPLNETGSVRANNVLDELKSKVLERFVSGGLPVEQVKIVRSIDMRFGMQVHELNVDLPENQLSLQNWNEIAVEFTRKYEATYGKDSAYVGAGFEYVTLRVVGTILRSRPALTENAQHATAARTSVKRRLAYFPGTGLIETEILSGEDLKAGAELVGPAIIQRVGDTVVLPPGCVAKVDRHIGLNIFWPKDQRSSEVGIESDRRTLEGVS